MLNLVFLGICLFFGFLLRSSKKFPPHSSKFLSTVILYIPLPALILLKIPDLEWDLNLISLTLVPWLMFGMSFVTFHFFGPRFGFDKRTTGCLILMSGLGNTSFVGFPVIEALLGAKSLKHAVFLDQTGSFLVVSSLGIWVANHYAEGKASPFLFLRKMLTFPPFIAFFLALFLSFFEWKVSGISRLLLEKFGLTLAPLAFIVVGLQLNFNDIKDDVKSLTLGLIFKLFLGPLFIFATYKFFDVSSPLFQVSVLESAMAPMIVASILAANHDLHPRLAGKMIGIGVPLSFVTLSLWYWILKLN